MAGRPRQFDLITCADSWHWINPDLGVLKVARVLRAGGTIARFGSSFVVDEPVIAAFDTAYRRYAPDITQVWRPAGSKAHGHADSDGVDPFAGNDMFYSVEARTYQWEQTLSADEWVGLAATVSDHQRLGQERLTALLQALHAPILTLGGTVRSHNETHVLLARRTGK